MNKTAVLSILLLLVLSLFGCAVQQPAVQDIEGEDIDLEVQEEEPEPEVVEEEPEEIEEEPAEAEEEKEEDYNFEALPKDVQRKVKMVRNLLDEARDREENYFFRYSDPSTLQTDVWVKGDLMKRSIWRADELDKDTTYNMVYLNSKTLKAEGYCETTKSKCFEGHGPFTETYSKWDIKTPKDWVMELGDDFKWTLDNKISDQLYHIIDYHQEDKVIRVFVNDYRGWPARVEIYPPTANVDSVVTGRPLETYIYDDMDIGGVSDDDVTPG